MQQNQSPDPKRIFLAMALIAFFLLGFEIFSYYFLRSPQNTSTPQTAQEADVKPENKSSTPQKSEELPKLMLGSTREKTDLKEVYEFTFGNYEIAITPVGGRIVKVVDKAFGFDLIAPAEKQLKVFPLEIHTGDPDLDYRINFGRYEVIREGDRLLLRLKDNDIKLIKEISFKDSHFYLKITTNLDKRLYVLAGAHPEEDSFYTHQGPVLKLNGEVIRIDKDDVKGRQVYEGSIEFAGEESRYFFKGFKGSIGSVVVERANYKTEEGEEVATFTYVEYREPLFMYMGAKYYSRIREVGLGDLLDWGMLKIFVKPLFIFMYWVYEHTGSWILSIVLLTFLLRIVFFPLNYKSTTSMMKLQEVAPRIEKIRKKYKDDPAKMQEEMMKLYSEVGFNPMSGCLPILVQIPVFFALYKVLIITVDLKLSSMLWIPSLADKDPFYILPVIMGLTMILQQKVTPNPDPKQNFIMYISAVAFTFLFASFPSGLVLYWTVNNVLNIAQNYLIKNVILKKK